MNEFYNDPNATRERFWTDPQEVGPPSQRELYTEAAFLRDLDHALHAYSVPGYPAYEDRLRMQDRSKLLTPSGDITLPYDSSQPWCPADFYPTHAPKPMREEQFIDGGDVYPPTEKELAEWESLGVRLDTRGMPVHPHAEAMLLGGHTPDGTFVQPGGVVTPGYYYNRGPQKTGDFLLVAPDKGVLKGLIIKRGDNGLLASPGGHLEPEDAQLSRKIGWLNEYAVGAIREHGEETGVTIDIHPDGLTCAGLKVILKKTWKGCGADQRLTLHSWPQGEGYVGILERIPDQQPAASSDADQASWEPLSEATIANMARMGNHGTLGRRAIRAYRDETGARIDPGGGIWFGSFPMDA